MGSGYLAADFDNKNALTKSREPLAASGGAIRDFVRAILRTVVPPDFHAGRPA
jgi:hypothetical protein